MERKISTHWIAAVLLVLATTLPAGGQSDIDHSYRPLVLKLDESGSKYVRFIIWHQQWLQTNNLAQEDTRTRVSSMVRRSRFLAYAQISPRFLILTHFGLNNLSEDNLTSLGNNGDGPQLFLHDAWTEFKVSRNNNLYLGGGLHYWRGLTRLASQSTLNFMTMDNSRPFVHWHSLGVTDQFARHLGVYAKGEIGKFDYRLALNTPMNTAVSGIGGGKDYGTAGSGLTYTGSGTLTEEGASTGHTVLEGYGRYNLWDAEAGKLPYNVGSYLGTKRVLAIGAGFFAHPNGMFNTENGAHQDVLHLAVDAFLDMPLMGEDCLNLYAALMHFDYGKNYVGRWAGTGTVLYGQIGYLFPKLPVMPYLAFQATGYQGFEENPSVLDIGINYFLNGHSAKLTLEYHTVANDPREAAGGDVQQLRLQAHIFL